MDLVQISDDFRTICHYTLLYLWIQVNHEEGNKPEVISLNIYSVELVGRVNRWAGAKTASVLPKKRKLLNRAPKKSALDLQKKRQLVLFKPKKSATDLQKYPIWRLSANSGHPGGGL